MLLSQHDHIIQALAPDAAHKSFRKRVLPRALRGYENYGSALVPEPIAKTFAVNLVSVSVSDQISWRPAFREIFQRFVEQSTPTPDVRLR